MKDAIELEDYEEEGLVSLSALKEAFNTIEVNIDEELMDYILYVIY